jgi:outer membrane biogenesis lipoprotein LolB
MKTTFLLLIVVLFLTGCPATIPTAPDVVEVPVAVRCKPTVQITKIQDYAYDRAVKEMSLYEKFQLAMSELSTVRGQNKELDAALKECTK